MLFGERTLRFQTFSRHTNMKHLPNNANSILSWFTKSPSSSFDIGWLVDKEIITLHPRISVWAAWDNMRDCRSGFRQSCGDDLFASGRLQLPLKATLSFEVGIIRRQFDLQSFSPDRTFSNVNACKPCGDCRALARCRLELLINYGIHDALEVEFH